jgi:hypothetical protein
MSRRRQEPPSSLDLLLDTICNTFGGVLFLAIAISVLLKTSSRIAVNADTVDSSTATESLERESRLESLSARLESLRIADNQQQKLAEQFAPPETAKLLAELRDIKQQRDLADVHRRAALGQISADRQRVSQINLQEREQAASVKEAERDLALATKELESETKTRTRTAKLPHVHSTSRTEVAVALRYGRLYVCHHYDRFGSRAGLNSDDFVIIDEGVQQVTATPKPYAGIPVQAANARPQLEARLKAFDPRRHYFAVIVWEDSFEACQMLKNVMVESGFEYRLLLLPDGESATDRGGKGGRVQ